MSNAVWKEVKMQCIFYLLPTYFKLYLGVEKKQYICGISQKFLDNVHADQFIFFKNTY